MKRLYWFILFAVFFFPAFDAVLESDLIVRQVEGQIGAAVQEAIATGETPPVRGRGTAFAPFPQAVEFAASRYARSVLLYLACVCVPTALLIRGVRIRSRWAALLCAVATAAALWFGLAAYGAELPALSSPLILACAAYLLYSFRDAGPDFAQMPTSSFRTARALLIGIAVLLAPALYVSGLLSHYIVYVRELYANGTLTANSGEQWAAIVQSVGTTLSEEYAGIFVVNLLYLALPLVFCLAGVEVGNRRNALLHALLAVGSVRVVLFFFQVQGTFFFPVIQLFFAYLLTSFALLQPRSKESPAAQHAAISAAPAPSTAADTPETASNKRWKKQKKKHRK